MKYDYILLDQSILKGNIQAVIYLLATAEH